jgi:hypothetical protein
MISLPSLPRFAQPVQDHVREDILPGWVSQRGEHESTSVFADAFSRSVTFCSDYPDGDGIVWIRSASLESDLTPQSNALIDALTARAMTPRAVFITAGINKLAPLGLRSDLTLIMRHAREAWCAWLLGLNSSPMSRRTDLRAEFSKRLEASGVELHAATGR